MAHKSEMIGLLCKMGCSQRLLIPQKLGPLPTYIQYLKLDNIVISEINSPHVTKIVPLYIQTGHLNWQQQLSDGAI